MGRPPKKPRDKRYSIEITLSVEALERLDALASASGATWRGKPNRSLVIEELIMDAPTRAEETSDVTR